MEDRESKAVGETLRNFLKHNLEHSSCRRWGSNTILCAYWSWWIWYVRNWDMGKKWEEKIIV